MSYKKNALPLREGKVNLVNGVVLGGGVYVCVEEGSLNIIWASGGTDTIYCVAGDAYDFVEVTSVEVASGIFHRA